MYYLDRNCSVCIDGMLGFRRCSDGKTLAMMCDECDSVWLGPEFTSELPIVTRSPEFLLPNSAISIVGGPAGWASLEEIVQAGFGRFASSDRRYDP